jgi:hypothetical protein
LHYGSSPVAGHELPKSRLSTTGEPGSSDENLQIEARKFISRHSDWAIDEKLTAALGGPDYPKGGATTTELALADMDLLYNIGVVEKDKYGSPTKNSAHLDLALKAFEKAWRLRDWAAANARIYFAIYTAARSRWQIVHRSIPIRVEKESPNSSRRHRINFANFSRLRRQMARYGILRPTRST